MIRKISLAAFAVAVVGVASGPASAAPVRYQFDKDHTQIIFFSDHLGYSKQQGEFQDFDINLTFDEVKPEDSTLEVTIKTDSIDMDMERWDKHLKSKDFFDVAEYPEMTFKSTKIEVTGDHTADVTGDLTLLGQTHPVVLHTTLLKTGQSPLNGKHVVGFEATGTLDRSQWGMDYGVPMMDPNIELRIDAEASPVDEAEEGAVNK